MYYVNAQMAGRYAYQLQDNPEENRQDLSQLNKMAEDGTMDLLPKKEVIKLNLEKERLEKFLGGIKEMQRSSFGNVRC